MKKFTLRDRQQFFLDSSVQGEGERRNEDNPIRKKANSIHGIYGPLFFAK